MNDKRHLVDGAADPDLMDSLWLVRIIVIDLSAAALGVLMLSLVYLFVLPRSDVLVAILIVFAGGIVMSRAVRPARQRREGAAVVWLSIANWMTALLMTAVASFAWPLTVTAALIPAVLAASYTFGGALWGYVSISMAVAVAAATLGELRADAGLSAVVPGWLSTSVLIGWTPMLGIVIALIAHQNSSRLHATIDRLTESNRQLEVSRLELCDQADALRRSRMRIVTATDHARRRIQRDLHDGAQQRLVALAMKIGALCDEPPPDQAVATYELHQIGAELRLVQVELRALASGVYPSVLADGGPAVALEWATDRSSTPVHVDGDQATRNEPDVEAAVYFCCLEAIQNATKHAGPDAVIDVTIASTDDWIRFTVTDDGNGFDPDDVHPGLGLDDMHDRIAAFGGQLVIESQPGDGTTLRGAIPVEHSVARQQHLVVCDEGRHETSRRADSSSSAPPSHHGPLPTRLLDDSPPTILVDDLPHRLPSGLVDDVGRRNDRGSDAGRGFTVDAART